MGKNRQFYFGYKYNYFFIFFIIFFTILITNIISADEIELKLDITDINYEKINEIYENENFLVSIYYINSEGLPIYQTDVEIEFNNKKYQILLENENPEIILNAPNVSKNSIFIIKASKTGFTSNYSNFTVINKLQLIIEPEDYTVNANNQFSVLVMDENRDPLENVKVAIQSYTGTQVQLQRGQVCTL